MQKETDTLERLIDLTQDSINGYLKAADLVQKDDPSLASLFEKRCRGRTQIREQLRSRLRIMDPTNDALNSEGTTTGRLHQSFMRFRSAFQDNRKVALTEIDHGESILVKAYEQALEEGQAELRPLLERCLASISKDEQSASSLRERI